MKGQQFLILALALVFGLVAVFLANDYLLARAAPAVPGVPGGTTKVAVARVALDFGAPVTPEKVRLVDWPINAMPEGALGSLIQFEQAGRPRVALRPIAPNEPILARSLSGEGGRATLSQMLRPDMRAASVKVGDVVGVAGFVLPGDTVDVLVTRSAGGMNGSGQQITDVLLQKVRVIAIDQDASDRADKPVVGKTATLEVAQVDAQKLALAQQVGQLSLVLANPAADRNPRASTISIADLRDGVATAAIGLPRERVARRTIPEATYRQRRLRAAPQAVAASTVVVVRGLQNTSYEVGRYVGL